jgi:hypothetical protein
MASALAKRAACSMSGALTHAASACLLATPSTACRAPYSASAVTAAAAPNTPASLVVPPRTSRARIRASSPASTIAMAANWPTWTAVQISLPAYAAKMAGWSFASPPVWNWVITMYRSCPTSSSVADGRSDGLNGSVFMAMLLVYSPNGVSSQEYDHEAVRVPVTSQRVEKRAIVCGAVPQAPWVRLVESGHGMNAGRGESAGRRVSAAPLGNGRRPQPRQRSRRLRLCPAAISNASPLTLSRPRQRKRRSPCQAFASAKNGSTHPWRLRIALAQASVSW